MNQLIIAYNIATKYTLHRQRNHECHSYTPPVSAFGFMTKCFLVQTKQVTDFENKVLAYNFPEAHSLLMKYEYEHQKQRLRPRAALSEKIKMPRPRPCPM